MDRHPTTLDDAADVIASTDRRSDARLAADVVQAAVYLVPGRCDVRERRAAAARLVRDALALLAATGGTADDVNAAAHLARLYRPGSGADDRTVGDRGARGPAVDGCVCPWTDDGGSHVPACPAARGPHHDDDHVTGYVVGPAADLAFPAVTPTSPDTRSVTD
jgi:hypothetical protein